MSRVAAHAHIDAMPPRVLVGRSSMYYLYPVSQLAHACQFRLIMFDIHHLLMCLLQLRVRPQHSPRFAKVSAQGARVSTCTISWLTVELHPRL